MEAVIRVLMAGPGVTLQDSGRQGYLRFGVTPAGPMDPLAFATVNRALGNAPGTVAIEVGLGGLEFTVDSAPLTVAIAGGDFVITLDGRRVPPAVLLRLDVGATVKITAGSAGAWCYMAIAGRLLVAPMLGSTATHTRSGFGGLDGRALASGDRLGIAEPRMLDAASGILEAPWLDRPSDVIRVVLGPQEDYFAPDQIAAFLAGPWTLSTKGDRMAYFLEGPKLDHAEGFNIVSDGVAMGAIQVPGEGQPIVLMADRQPTGGYPKIATVIGPDLGRLAQARAGSRFRFEAVSIDEAVAARRAEMERLEAGVAIAPLRRTEFSPGFLLGLNLTDGIGGGTVVAEDRHSVGKLTAHERLEVLFDDAHFERLAGTAPSALIQATGEINGRRVYAASRDIAVRGGALTTAEMQVLAGLLDRAAADHAPIVLFFDGSASAADDAETWAATIALHAAFRPSAAPRIAVVLGACVGPDALLATLADFVIVTTDQGFIASGGPVLVQKVTNELLTGAEIGGAAVHAAAGGLVDAVFHDIAAVARVRDLLAFMPDGETCAVKDMAREAQVLDRLVPYGATEVYDVRDILSAIADEGAFLEVAAEGAANLVTGFIRLAGKSVGVLANQPRVLGGVLDAAALAKATRFVERCAALSLSLLTVVDCPGLLPGPAQEKAGRLQQAAALSRALAQFTQPRVTLITRNVDGPAAALMGIGQGKVYRWPSAPLGLGEGDYPAGDPTQHSGGVRLMSQMFGKILIANRGEIACRVIKTARRIGIATVAVYSEADRDALHVRMADEAVAIGPAPASQSYLSVEAIIAACKQTGAEAVHPGYGFLSERAPFVDALQAAGIVFIGPNPMAIGAMGDKIESKKAAAAAGVRTVPGFLGVIENPVHAAEIAESIGYPVMIKASAGGGGKGMRIAHSAAEVAEGFARARSEAASSFGDDRVFIEKFIENPRHIEIQVLGDKHGNVIHLGERECSVQRRHQKVLEEAPSPLLDEATREAMGAQAIALAQAVAYDSAGTVEFVAGQDRSFYFLEMNTRLQVEHPVTELVTGIDIVEEMIRIAAGERLRIAQSDVKLNGWAVEARIYAEDPARGFQPSTGRVLPFQPPAEGEIGGVTVRVDTGLVEGDAVSVYYDPMIAKLITHAPTRAAAIAAQAQALDRFAIGGIRHNLAFLSSLMGLDLWQEGRLSTGLIAEAFGETVAEPLPEGAMARSLVAIVAANQHRADRARRARPGRAALVGPQARVVTMASLEWRVTTEGTDTVLVNFDGGGALSVASDWRAPDPIWSGTVDGGALSMQLDRTADGWALRHAGIVAMMQVWAPRAWELSRFMPQPSAADADSLLLSPMPGLLGKLLVQVGDEVAEDQPLAVIEAMKMETVLRSRKAGLVAEIYFKPGDTLPVDAPILKLA